MTTTSASTTSTTAVKRPTTKKATPSRATTRSTARPAAVAGQLVRRAPRADNPAHPLAPTLPLATLRDFRWYLRGLRQQRGGRVTAGYAGVATRCPVAVWLREERGYGHVQVAAGDTAPTPMPYAAQTGVSALAPDLSADGRGASGRRARFTAWDARTGAPLGVGVCDNGLTCAIDYLDGYGASLPGRSYGQPGALLSVVDCLAALDEMEREWPPIFPPTATLIDTSLIAETLAGQPVIQPAVQAHVGIASGSLGGRHGERGR